MGRRQEEFGQIALWVLIVGAFGGGGLLTVLVRGTDIGPWVAILASVIAAILSLLSLLRILASRGRLTGAAPALTMLTVIGVVLGFVWLPHRRAALAHAADCSALVPIVSEHHRLTQQTNAALAQDAKNPDVTIPILSAYQTYLVDLAERLERVATSDPTQRLASRSILSIRRVAAAHDGVIRILSRMQQGIRQSPDLVDQHKTEMASASAEMTAHLRALVQPCQP